VYLKYGRGRGHGRERRLNAAGGVSGEGSLNKLPLKIIGGVGGGLDVTGMLFGSPFGAGFAYDKCEDSHGHSERNPNSKLKSRREQSCSDGLWVGRIVYVAVRLWNPSAEDVKSPFSPFQYFIIILFVNLVLKCKSVPEILGYRAIIYLENND